MSSDSGVDVSSGSSKPIFTQADIEKELVSPTDTDKEVVVMKNDFDKQFYDRTADSSKQVRDLSLDTEKQAVPSSSEKELAIPRNNLDKEALHRDSGEDQSSPTTRPIAAFRVEKSNPLGLVIPQSQKLLLRALDPVDKIDQGPAFVTNDMDWVDVLAVNPPPFELYTAHDFNQSQLVARFLPRGWQGLVGMSSEFEVSAQGERQKWEVVRKGLTRTYHLRGLAGHKGTEFAWKGSTKTVESMAGKEKRNKGSLKLVTAEGVVLAVWQQWRDSHILGDVLIFEDARRRIAVEVILTSCICVVSAERANGLNWIGGLGK
ncbi:hypothetical protein B0A52_01590 [Exophiala mesophila]|uniref:Uncharacterized protein n=1 Tax=Exophiala mesophila TaxID=212818 RepID=A0A438NFG3_EXOME|nr:hypothetical protein B0A52_01590 [Exophiala mesophila]